MGHLRKINGRAHSVRATPQREGSGTSDAAAADLRAVADIRSATAARAAGDAIRRAVAAAAADELAARQGRRAAAALLAGQPCDGECVQGRACLCGTATCPPASRREAAARRAGTPHERMGDVERAWGARAVVGAALVVAAVLIWSSMFPNGFAQ